jgi:hypothetical protein
MASVRDQELSPRSIRHVVTQYYLTSLFGRPIGSWIGHTTGILVVCVPPISHLPNLGVELVTPLCYKCYASTLGLEGSPGGRDARA